MIGVALALPACLHLLIANVQAASGNWHRSVEISAYLKRPTALEEAERLAQRVRQRRDVAFVEIVSAEEALKEFRRESGFGEAMEALTENPLPIC